MQLMKENNVERNLDYHNLEAIEQVSQALHHFLFSKDASKHVSYFFVKIIKHTSSPFAFHEFYSVCGN